MEMKKWWLNFCEESKNRLILKNSLSLIGISCPDKKNPKSRDILYNLYLLEKAEGNITKAEEYLIKAKEIDPMIRSNY